MADAVLVIDMVVVICDTHDLDDLEFHMCPVHCVQGTEEAEVIPGLSGYQGEVIHKRRYSVIFDTYLEERLAKLNPDKVIVCRVCTDVCVMHATADARNRDYDAEVPTDCVTAFYPQAHSYALQHMEKALAAKLAEAPTFSHG